MNAPLMTPRAVETADPLFGQSVSLSILIGRIDEAVQQETHSLRNDRDFDIGASNARKSRFLYELNRAVKAIDPSDLTPAHRAALLSLRETLTRNEATIRAHLEAVNEVATLMRDAIRTAEADGTYSAGAFGYGE